jgi:DNA-directed RNA polymerase subunit alpha
MSSIEGIAVVSIEIDEVSHEFQRISDMVEDVIGIILNIKRVLFEMESKKNMTLNVDVTREEEIFARDITGDGEFTVLNPDQILCILDTKQRFSAKLEFQIGRGSLLGNQHPRRSDISLLLVDAMFTPVKLGRYSVADMRVGQMTDYDKLVQEIWTDERVTPAIALKEASAILKYHMSIFDGVSDEEIEFDDFEKEVNDKQNFVRNLLNMSINQIELSVHAANCLNNANIMTASELVSKT